MRNVIIGIIVVAIVLIIIFVSIRKEDNTANVETKGTSGEVVEMLDGDYTYIDNDILMEMIKGEWKSDEFSLNIKDDYTFTLADKDEVVLGTTLDFTFLQPGAYQDVDFRIGESEFGTDVIEDFHSEMNFDKLEDSKLIMEIKGESDEKTIEFTR